MKILTLPVVLLLLFCFSISGCVSVSRLTSRTYIPLSDPEDLEIYHYGHYIRRPYIELAEITLTSKNVHKLRQETTRLGADAVIILGPASSSSLSNNLNIFRNFPSALTFGLGFSSSKSGEWSAIAIKFTDLDDDVVVEEESNDVKSDNSNDESKQNHPDEKYSYDRSGNHCECIAVWSKDNKRVPWKCIKRYKSGVTVYTETRNDGYKRTCTCTPKNEVKVK